MNIAELFINLGVKGSEKTLGGVLGVQKGLKDTASTSLEAKAAIVGAMYALERLFSASNKAGADLTNFTATVGTSAQTLQQYQYAARQVGVSNEAVTGSFKTLQQQMTKTLMGEGAPKGLARVSQLLGDFSAKDIEEFSRKPELLFQKLQEYANKERSIPLRNEVLKSFGLGDDIIGSMARNAYRPDVFKKAPTYSDKEIGALDRANTAWSNLGTKIEMAVGHFNAKHGGELVNDISKITDKVITLSEAFMKLAEKAELFKWLGKVFEGWQLIFEGLTKAVDFLNEVKTPDDDKKEKRTEAERANDPTYVPPHLKGASENVIKAWHDDEKRRLETKKSVSEAWSGFTDFVAAQYGEHVLGVAHPEEKANPKAPENLFAKPGSRPDAQVVEPPSAKHGKPAKGTPESPINVQIKGPTWSPVVAPAYKGASTPTTMAKPTAMGVKPTMAAPTAVSKPTAMAVGVALPERRLKLVPPPTAVPPAKSLATPPPSLPARQAAAGPGGAKGAAPAVVNFEQNLSFGGAAADPARTATAARNGVREAYREIAAQGEGG